jgi:hypothetical protein
MNKLAYPKKYIKYMLFYIVFAHPVPVIYAYINKYYITSIINLFLMFTSLVYWQNPVLTSNRRYTDITMVAIAGSHHIIQFPQYIPIYMFGSSMYCVSSIFHMYKMYILSIISHCSIHFIISIAAIMAYNFN